MNNNQANTTPTSIHRPPTEADFALSSLTSSTQFNARPHTQSQTKLPSTQPVIQQNGLPTPSTTPGATTPVLAVTRSLQECQISGNVPIPMTTSPTSLSNPSSSALGAQSVGFLPLPPNAPSSSPHQSGPESKSETPLSGMSMPSTATSSPRLPPLRQNSGSQTPRVRPHATTLNIPGMTRSKASPDGKIAERDVAAKLVIVMVGLPARGKSYITNKLQRYLSWQQHNSRIFNVGNRRRVVAGLTPATALPDAKPSRDASKVASMILGGGPVNLPHPPELNLNDPNMDQSAQFFDPSNTEAAKLREQVAMATLDELLDYLLLQGGSIGILDATNSTLKRRQMIVERIKARDDKLGIIFIESICNDKDLLEANMRLKLSGPDYRDKDPNQSLEDFRRRVHAYEKAYTPLGEWEEKNDLQYIQMINVGQKIIQYRLRGFLSGGIASYLASFNLSPRQIWITRHGVSVDNEAGKLGGDSELTERGHIFGHDLYEFMTQKRKEWLYEQTARTMNSSFPPLPGDHTPPYPEINRELNEKNFCIWTSMMKRSVETAEYFEADEDYDVKNWEMLNELNAGNFEGMTYKDIEERHPEEYKKRQNDKLNYIYPGVGGEGYLQVISRMRDMEWYLPSSPSHTESSSTRTATTRRRGSLMSCPTTSLNASAARPCLRGLFDALCLTYLSSHLLRFRCTFFFFFFLCSCWVLEWDCILSGQPFFIFLFLILPPRLYLQSPESNDSDDGPDLLSFHSLSIPRRREAISRHIFIRLFFFMVWCGPCFWCFLSLFWYIASCL